MLMFNTLVDLIKYLQANQVRNNSQFQLDGVNISVENLSNDNSDIFTTRKNVKSRLSKIVKKETLNLSKNGNNKKVDSNLNEKISLLKIRYHKCIDSTLKEIIVSDSKIKNCKRVNEKKKLQMHLNRLRNKLSQDTVKSNSNEISIVSEITDCDLNKSVIASNEEPMEIDISKNNILKNLIRPNVDVNSTFKQEKDIKVKIKKSKKIKY
uniref:Uncharacterized protein n=1 Tax=Strongyloides venezuelensis TaxID=75913 RepID=A0A0K0FSF2_STRVS